MTHHAATVIRLDAYRGKLRGLSPTPRAAATSAWPFKRITPELWALINTACRDALERNMLEAMEQWHGTFQIDKRIK